MDKLKRVFKKEYLLVLFFAFVILSFLILEPIEDLDELWNYNTARCIADGLIPYKDISMITTPLLPMINAVFLKILGNEVFVMRILAGILGALILFLTFNILKKLFKETNISLICTFLLYLLYQDFFCIDYNFFVLFLVLCILNLEIKYTNKIYSGKFKGRKILVNLNKNQKTNLIIGILSGLCICTKQSIGVLVAFITAIYPIVWIRNKKDIKLAISSIVIRVLGIIIPGVIFLIYLIATGALNDFIGYAIKGISHFDNSILYKTLFESEKLSISIISKALPLMFIICLGFSIFSKKNKNEYRNLLLLNMYSIPMLILMYPISDEIHFLIAVYLFLVTFLYLIFGIFAKWIYSKINLRKKKKIYKILTLLIFIFIFASVTSEAVTNYYDYYKQDKNNVIEHYNGISIHDYLVQRINGIDEFIKNQNSNGKRVYILDAEAAVYNIPLNIYNKDYDMFLKGNIGENGQEGLIEKVKKQSEDKNNLFLVRQIQYSQNWQTPLKVVEYVRNNLEKIDEVEFYDVYVGK